MWKELVYGGVTYPNFLINKRGDIKNIKTNHIYKPIVSKGGYVVITLPMGKRGLVKTIRLHKALAETFIPNPNNFKVVHHKDGNKLNYSIDNLEWTSYKDNTVYYLDEVSKDSPFFNNRKLTKRDVEFIKSNKGNYSYNAFAKMFNVSKTTIVNVMNGKLYNNGVW